MKLGNNKISDVIKNDLRKFLYLNNCSFVKKAASNNKALFMRVEISTLCLEIIIAISTESLIHWQLNQEALEFKKSKLVIR